MTISKFSSVLNELLIHSQTFDWLDLPLTATSDLYRLGEELQSLSQGKGKSLLALARAEITLAALRLDDEPCTATTMIAKAAYYLLLAGQKTGQTNELLSLLSCIDTNELNAQLLETTLVD